MKLIDVDTGNEYELKNIPHIFTLDFLRGTGRKFEKREGFTNQTSNRWDFTRTVKCDYDTHRAICFLEPLEKDEPMPEIWPGDCVSVIDEFSTSRKEVYIKANTSYCWMDKTIEKIYRNGKLTGGRNEIN